MENIRNFPYCLGNMESLDRCCRTGCPYTNDCLAFKEFIDTRVRKDKTKEECDDIRYRVISVMNSDYWINIQDMLYVIDNMLKINEET